MKALLLLICARISLLQCFVTKNSFNISGEECIVILFQVWEAMPQLQVRAPTDKKKRCTTLLGPFPFFTTSWCWQFEFYSTWEKRGKSLCSTSKCVYVALIADKTGIWNWISWSSCCVGAGFHIHFASHLILSRHGLKNHQLRSALCSTDSACSLTNSFSCFVFRNQGEQSGCPIQRQHMCPKSNAYSQRLQAYVDQASHFYSKIIIK